jgi:hypothetical protein
MIGGNEQQNVIDRLEEEEEIEQRQRNDLHKVRTYLCGHYLV